MADSQTPTARERAAHQARAALQIIRDGQYRAPSGRMVQVGYFLEWAKRDGVSYPPDAAPFPAFGPGPYDTRVEVMNETTLAAAQRLYALDSYGHPAALVFASAKNAGGGFLNGALAQEEYLARSSGLYACLRGNPMYSYHRARRDLLYSDYAIYAPMVPVFRGDDGVLLESPYVLSFIVSPAVNARALDPQRRAEIGPAMWQRILRVLSIGVLKGHDSMVLGAWGCGVYGNDGQQIAELFGKALAEDFKGAFRQVIFAIPDDTRQRKHITPFERVFGPSVAGT